MGESSETVAAALFRAFFELVERDGQAATLRRAGIAQGTFDHWQKARADGRMPGLNRANFEAMCSIPEVRAALAAKLLRRPESHSTAWEAIAGELSRLMDAATGWLLVKKLTALHEVGLLDGGLSALEGMITARRRARVEKSQNGNRAEPEKNQKS